jgi:hypothetical protein
MSEQKTYEQGIEEGIKRAFDLLTSMAANTTDDVKANIINDAAEEVLAEAPTYDAMWRSMLNYGKSIRESAIQQKLIGEVISNNHITGWVIKPSVPFANIPVGEKIYVASQSTIKVDELLSDLAKLEGHAVPPKDWLELLKNE